MNDLLRDFSIGFYAGVASGIFSGMLLYFHITKIEKYRNILNYAERTSDYYFEIIEYARTTNNDNFDNFKWRCIHKNIYRGFWGDIKDGSDVAVKLKDAIANCNTIISRLEGLDIEALHTYINCRPEIPNASLDIGNAKDDYSQKKYKRVGKINTFIKMIIATIAFICLIILIIA